MRERPILFSGVMVQAILEGRKTQTRRLVKPQPIGGDSIIYNVHQKTFLCGRLRDSENAWREIRPRWWIGDQLWVRETFRETGSAQMDDGKLSVALAPGHLLYRADGHEYDGPWRSAIHMPRWASRITLKVMDIQARRLQEINERDAYCEGIPEWKQPDQTFNPIVRFRELWDSINGQRSSWESNPWVWVIEFRKLP